ncbi:uncharacterized protein LOC144103508 [Amblyomma americanum]
MSIAPLARAMRSDGGAILHQVVNLQERRKALLKERSDTQIDDYYLSTAYDASTGSAEESLPEPEEPSPSEGEYDNHKHSSTGFRNKTQKERPNRFVVEMCMVTSKEYSSQFNSTEELIQYIALMLNAAALSFIDLKDPKIRFQLNQVFTNLCTEN